MTPDLIRTHDAAILVGRDPVTIRRWIQKGWLTRHGARRRQTLVDRDEVLRTEAALAAGRAPLSTATRDPTSNVEVSTVLGNTS